MSDDINRSRAEKCRLEERLKAVRQERQCKQAAYVAVFRKRAAAVNLLHNTGERVKLIQHRVTQQQAEITDLRRCVAEKAESVKHSSAEVRYKANFVFPRLRN